jgi:Ca-activated chloride channel family protein
MPRFARRRSRILNSIVSGIVLIFVFDVPTHVARTQLHAQDADPAAIRVTSNLVMLDATVKTKTGEIMSDLKQEDFEVREDGVAQKIDLFSRDDLPLNVALVLDVSASIRPFLGPLRDAATIALATLKPDDRVALFTFAKNVELRVPFTTDKGSVAAAISSLSVEGDTNINDAIFDAAKNFLATAPAGRRVIILISDDVGDDAGAESTREIAAESIAAEA